MPAIVNWLLGQRGLDPNNLTAGAQAAFARYMAERRESVDTVDPERRR